MVFASFAVSFEPVFAGKSRISEPVPSWLTLFTSTLELMADFEGSLPWRKWSSDLQIAQRVREKVDDLGSIWFSPCPLKNWIGG